MPIVWGYRAAIATVVAVLVFAPIAEAKQAIPPDVLRSQNNKAIGSKSVIATSASADGERLRSEQTVDSYRKAVKKYEESLLVWRAAGGKRQEADTLKNLGEICHLLNDAKKALRYYARALVLCRQLRDIRLEGEIHNDIGSAYLHLGDNQRALEHCTKALQLGREISDKKSEASALNNLGEVAYAFGDLTKALDYYRAALPLWLGLGDRRGQAQTILYLGYSFSDLADSKQALDSYENALSRWRAIGDRHGEALTLIAIGHLRSRCGEKQESLNYYQQAMPLIQTAGDLVWQGSILVSTGSIYQELGDHKRALDYYDRAVRAFRAAHYPKGLAGSLWMIGRTYYAIGDYVRSMSLLQRSLAVISSLADRRLEPYARSDIGVVLDSIGAHSRALEEHNKALELYHSGRDQRGEAYALNNIGSVWYRLGEQRKALAFYEEALALNRVAGDRFGESETLYNIARARRDLGNLDDARANIEAALDLNETLRFKIGVQELRATYFGSVQQNYELYVDLLMRSNKLHPDDGLAAAALKANERARARSLIEMLSEARADIRQGVDASLLQHERSLQQALMEREERYSKLLTGTHTNEQLAGAETEIGKTKTEYQQVQAQIRASSPRYAALTQPQPLSLDEIQKEVLDSGTILLEYALGDERSYLWAVTSNSLATFELPKRSEIEASARRVYELLAGRNQNVAGETELQRQKRWDRIDVSYWAEATALSQMLFGAVATQLGTKRLLIVADGALQYIPFGALPVPGTNVADNGVSTSSEPQSTRVHYDNPQPLIVEHEIVNLPSASTLAILRREQADRKPALKSVAVLADPVFSRFDSRVSRGAASSSFSAPRSRDFGRAIREVRISRNRGGVDRLPFSRVEANAIIAVAPEGQAFAATDFDASRATATSAQLSQYRIIHFATHGLLNSEHPELSGIVLSLVDRRGNAQNGFLRLDEVYNLKLPAELVVLSACQTGLGKDIRGEGLVGLTRGFMYAGAARVVASLWQVDDSATAQLMKRFYAKMLVEGLRPAAALREAQVEMLKQNRWQAPFYWAGFVIQGEWK